MSRDVHSCTHWLSWDPCTIPPISRIGTRIRGRYWSAKIDDISPGQVLRSVRECGMDNPFQHKSPPAGSLSSSQPASVMGHLSSLRPHCIWLIPLLSDGKGWGIRTSTHSLTGSTGKPDRDKLQWYKGRKRTRKKMLKVVNSEKQGGSGRWQMIDIGLGPWWYTYVLFSFYLASILE